MAINSFPGPAITRFAAALALAIHLLIATQSSARADISTAIPPPPMGAQVPAAANELPLVNRPEIVYGGAPEPRPMTVVVKEDDGPRQYVYVNGVWGWYDPRRAFHPAPRERLAALESWRQAHEPAWRAREIARLTAETARPTASAHRAAAVAAQHATQVAAHHGLPAAVNHPSLASHQRHAASAHR